MRPLPHHHADPGPDQVAPQQRGMNPDTIEARFINASMMLKVAIPHAAAKIGRNKGRVMIVKP
jgi:hypothetical protein